MRSLKPQWHCPVLGERAGFPPCMKGYSPFLTLAARPGQPKPTRAKQHQVVQRDRESSRLDQEQQPPSGRGSASKAPQPRGYSTGEGWGIPGAAVCQEGHERDMDTALHWATASESTQEATPAIPSRGKEVPDLHHWQLQRVLLSSRCGWVRIHPAGSQDVAHYTHLVQIKAITEA